jgi:hypothetical protein
LTSLFRLRSRIGKQRAFDDISELISSETGNGEITFLSRKAKIGPAKQIGLEPPKLKCPFLSRPSTSSQEKGSHPSTVIRHTPLDSPPRDVWNHFILSRQAIADHDKISDLANGWKHKPKQKQQKPVAAASLH